MKRRLEKKKSFDFVIKPIDMLHKHDAWQNNVIATLSSVKDDTHHAWTSVSYIITTDWPRPRRRGVCVCSRERGKNRDNNRE